MSTFKSALNVLDQENGRKYKPAKLIFNDLKVLSRACVDATLVQAIEIWPVLEATLEVVDGYGLSANQIGIQKRIAVIKYGNEIYRLLNPRIVATNGDKDTLVEGCLSFPKKTCKTLRYTEIIVEDDNIGRLELLSPSQNLLPVIFQHEIDHLNGITIFDRVQRPLKATLESKISRNSMCPCGSGKKYKKCCMK